MEYDESAARAVDEITDALIAAVAPIRFVTATTEREREAAFRLRCRAVVERGWRPESDFPDGLEREPLDDQAIHIVAWDGATPAGAVRLVLPDPGKPLPLEEAFGVPLDHPGSCVEVTRITVAREYSDTRHRLSAALLAASWREARTHGYVEFVGDIDAGMLRLYRRLGFTVVPLGPPVEYWGEPRTFARFDVLGSAERLRRRIPPAGQSG